LLLMLLTDALARFMVHRCIGQRGEMSSGEVTPSLTGLYYGSRAAATTTPRRATSLRFAA
jgi:hypothetical protein